MIPPFYDPSPASAPSPGLGAAPCLFTASGASEEDREHRVIRRVCSTPIPPPLARRRPAGLNGRVPVARLFVEGRSDVAAVVALARSQNVSLAAVEVVSLEGITNVRRELRAQHDGARTAVLCDAGETGFVTRALAADDLPRLPPVRVFVCDRDLEEELIRALGARRAAEVVRQVGIGDSFDRMSRQPQWRDEPVAAQLRRFAGAGAGRKELLAAAWATALPADAVPRPLADAVAWLRATP
ncbi:hypothetical protein [Microbacterium nymphoidis]|uniref:hypothetical protein n=1 Tax=Microbacterium nymphoidis TaxID=2898586 RepID=UPI001E31A15E|nr:hypothetical protein [Microbacterium nymphoidis]MCD2500105.1 hypothetical protein [Microbacterium nymphoidis]